MKINRNSYKPENTKTVLPDHNNYINRQLEPIDTVDLGHDKEWTFLFYNAGEGCEAKLCTSTMVDLEKAGSDENTNVIAMNYRGRFIPDIITGDYGRLTGAKTYYITKNETPPGKISSFIYKMIPDNAEDFIKFGLTGPRDIKSPVIEEHTPDTNMGDKETLKKFLVDNMKKYPAKHYAVILSGHGAAFGGSMIVHSPEEGRIWSEDLAEVFKEVQKETGRNIDIVDLNCCFGANIESVYPLGKSINTLVASQTDVFSRTQPFGKVLEDVQEGIKEGMEISGKDLAYLIIEESRHQTSGNLHTETLSAIDLKKIEDLSKSMNNFQSVIMAEKVPQSSIKKALENSIRFDYSKYPKEEYLTDIGSFADNLVEETDSVKVREASEELKKSLKECIFAKLHGEHEMESLFDRFVLRLYKKEKDLRGDSGLTVYYDTDAFNPESRLDQIQETEYADNVNSEEFLKYISQSPEENAVKKKLKKIAGISKTIENKIVSKTGLPGPVLDPLKKVSVMAGLAIGARLLGPPGLALFKTAFGSFIGAKGIEATFKNIKETFKKVSSREKLTALDKENIVDSASGAFIGLTTVGLGLAAMGIVSPGLIIPVILSNLAVKISKGWVKALINRKDHKLYKEKVKEFSGKSTEEKLHQAKHQKAEL